jgi:uncharacterized membrane protein
MHIYLGLLASVVGLGISSYIHRKKQTKTKLICPLRTQCDTVVNSQFATSFGIPNELLGMAYYILTGLFYAFILRYPMFFSPILHFALFFLTLGGMLFSIYLISLQAFSIRAWCVWCLGSAAANVLLVVSLFGFPSEGLFALLSAQRMWWVIAHNIGFILGLGGATITDLCFFRFLKDNTISKEEKGAMDLLSNIIWVGLAILIVSGIALYLPEQARLDVSSKFLLKVIVVSVVVVNGILLNMLVAPRLRELSLENTPSARHFRKIAFALGGISIFSWYTAFLLGSFRSISVSFLLGLCIYAGALLTVVIASQLYEAMTTGKSKN